jgi:hypothetical protein
MSLRHQEGRQHRGRKAHIVWPTGALCSLILCNSTAVQHCNHCCSLSGDVGVEEVVEGHPLAIVAVHGSVMPHGCSVP